MQEGVAATQSFDGLFDMRRRQAPRAKKTGAAVVGLAFLILASCGGSDADGSVETDRGDVTATEAVDEPAATDPPASVPPTTQPGSDIDADVEELTPLEIAYIEDQMAREREEAEVAAYLAALHEAELQEDREVEAYLSAVHQQEQREAAKVERYLAAVHREEVRQEREQVELDIVRYSALSNISTRGCWVTRYFGNGGFEAQCQINYVPPGWGGDEWGQLVVDRFVAEEEARQRSRWNSGPSYNNSGGDLDCEDFGYEFEIDPNDDPHGLDGDGDGIACEGW